MCVYGSQENRKFETGECDKEKKKNKVQIDAIGSFNVDQVNGR